MDGNGFSRRLPLLSRNPMWALLILGCALHVGKPEGTRFPVSPGEIRATGVEPGLQEALAAGFQEALAQRGALSASGGLRVDLEVLDASTEVVAATADASVRRAHLSVAVQAWGPQPARVVLTGERGYTVPVTDGLGASAARSEAFGGLARSLAADAATWVLNRESAP